MSRAQKTYTGKERPLKEVSIVVMGATGSGKSTFINLVSGANFGVSNRLGSCTQEVEVSPRFELDRYKVALIDTPGFDDTDRSDAEILQIIAAFLEAQYRLGIRVHGVLYLHKISDNRMGGVSKRSFGILCGLCGDKALKNVTIATTMWSKITPEEGRLRQEELKNDNRFFKPALDKGAKLVRHEGTIESAYRLLLEICSNVPMPLAIQIELVDENKPFYNTKAGQEVLRELQELVQKRTKDMANLKQEIAEAKRGKDEKAASELAEEQRKAKTALVRIRKEVKNLPSSYHKQRQRAMKMENRVGGIAKKHKRLLCF